MWDKLVLSIVDMRQLHRKCTVLNLSLPCFVEATACTSPEPDEYRLYPELPFSVKQKFEFREWILSNF